jgi:hypothetical protein
MADSYHNRNMSDRKYRQRGYQDDDRGERKGKVTPSDTPGSGPREERIGPRTPNMPGFREVVRCGRCGNLVSPGDPRCKRCGADLHTCAQCSYFDTGARFECTEPIPARISSKDTHNECSFYGLRVTVERETGSTAPTDARKAFDDLFK